MKVFFTILISVFITVNLNAQLYEVYSETSEIEHSFELFLKYEKKAAASYFDGDGNQVSELDDSSFVFIDEHAEILPDYFKRQYIMDLNQHIVELSGIYHINKEFKAYFAVPLLISTLDQRYKRQVFNNSEGSIIFPNVEKSAHSLTQIDYIALGGRYDIFKSVFLLGALAELRVPAGGDKSVLIENNEFLSDGALELMAGLDMGINFGNSSLTVLGMYKYRAEELQNQFIINSKFSFSTVENTAFNVYLDYTSPLERYPDYTFNILETPLQEEYLDGGVGFMFSMSRYIAEFQYKVRLYGTNSWLRSHFNLIFGYKF